MSLKDQPAFPEIKSKSDDPDNFNVTEVFSEGGMTLRQFAAIKAMQGMLAANFHPGNVESSAPIAAEQAVKFADALIAELEKSK